MIRPYDYSLTFGCLAYDIPWTLLLPLTLDDICHRKFKKQPKILFLKFFHMHVWVYCVCVQISLGFKQLSPVLPWLVLKRL